MALAQGCRRFLRRLQLDTTKLTANFIPFFVDESPSSPQHVGWINKDRSLLLQAYDKEGMFDVQADKYVRLVTNSSSSTTTPVETSIDNDREADIFHTQSRKLNDIVRCLHDAGVIRGWRNEQLRVGGTFDQPLCKVERGASDFFGFLTYGAHMNVYVCMSDDGDFDGGDSKVTGNARVEERDHLHSVSKPKKTKQMTEELKKRTPTHMWISQRSLTKPKAPGKLDNLVAGGIELGASPFDTIVKEAEEEAGIPARIAKHAQACGELTFRFIRQNEIMKELKSNCDVDNNTGCTSNVNTTYSTEGTDDSKHANDGNIDSPPSLALSHKPGQQFIFDLEVPPSFTPHNMDGEVEKFILLPIEEVLAQIALDDGRYELNSASVMIDFAMRHGFCDEWTKKEKEDIESVLRLPETSSQERDSFLAMPDEYSFDWQALGTGKSVGGSSKRDTE